MANKTPIIKATTASVGGPGADSAVGALNSALQNVQTIQGLLDPPYDMKKLSLLFEMSSALQQHVEAITTNVDLFGWKYEAAIKFDDPDIDKHVGDALYCEKIYEAETGGGKASSVKPPTETEIKQRLEELTWQSKAELNKLKNFFAVCYPDGSFIDLRTKTRKNLETTGNAYWEILRDQTGKISRIVLAPVCYIRLTPVDKEPTEIQERVPVSDITWTSVTQNRFFRRYAEVGNDQKKVKAYFKEFGDPRTVSRLTGRIYKDEATMREDKPNIKPEDSPATELLHLKIYSSFSDPYGVPRWIGNLPAVLGSRELDEVNLGYFENKTVPPLALLVAGGRLSKGVVPRIEEFIEQNLKGRKNFHKILILEAEGQKNNAGGMTVIPTVKFVPLREAQQQDALFQNYDEANWAKIGSSFRLPRILVGRDESINRSTSESSLVFAEAQVFEPMRNLFDEMINRSLLSDLEISFWKYRTNTPTTRDPVVLTDLVKKLSDAGVMTPAEARLIVADVFNKELPQIHAVWTQQPFRLTLAESKKGGALPAEFMSDTLDEADAASQEAAELDAANQAAASGDGGGDREDDSDDSSNTDTGDKKTPTAKRDMMMSPFNPMRALGEDDDN